MEFSPRHRALGDAIRAARKSRGVSQEQLGFASGLHRNHVGGVERGDLNPAVGTLWRLADGLGVPLSELIAEAERIATARHAGRPG